MKLFITNGFEKTEKFNYEKYNTEIIQKIEKLFQLKKKQDSKNQNRDN